MLMDPICTNLDCERASVGFVGVCEVDESWSGWVGFGGVGVRNFTSSFEMTACGSKGINPATLKPALTLFSVIVAL